MLFSKLALASASLITLLPCLASGAALNLRNSLPVQELTVNNNVGLDYRDQRLQLLYWTFNLVTFAAGTGIQTAVIPHTPPNLAAFGATTELTNGPAMISAKYETSEIQSFTLTSSYYGCSTGAAETVAGLPVSSNLTATAYNINNKQFPQQTFEYLANGALAQQMNFVEFNPGFQNVYQVVFTASSQMVAGLLDNTEVTIFGQGLSSR
ncbi:hypothetical protein MMC28_007149 [Mycoblastus sanguinarius]|nr:hypothetical protein [Mycoblastus sanguinarius]